MLERACVDRARPAVEELQGGQLRADLGGAPDGCEPPPQLLQRRLGLRAGIRPGQGLAESVVRQVGGKAIPLKSARDAEDLGITTSVGVRRVCKPFNKRIDKGINRAKRAQVLVRTNASASKLYMTGARPQQEYDANVVGTSPNQMAKPCRTAAISVRKAGAQPCITSLIRWRIGKDADPLYRIPKSQILLWAELWNKARDDAAERGEISEAWNTSLQKIIFNKEGWRAANGPLGAIIATLHDAKRQPISPYL